MNNHLVSEPKIKKYAENGLSFLRDIFTGHKEKSPYEFEIKNEQEVKDALILLEDSMWWIKNKYPYLYWDVKLEVVDREVRVRDDGGLISVKIYRVKYH